MPTPTFLAFPRPTASGTAPAFAANAKMDTTATVAAVWCQVSALSFIHANANNNVLDEPIRVNGKLNGMVNDLKLDEINLYSYVETRDGRVYTGMFSGHCLLLFHPL